LANLLDSILVSMFKALKVFVCQTSSKLSEIQNNQSTLNSTTNALALSYYHLWSHNVKRNRIRIQLNQELHDPTTKKNTSKTFLISQLKQKTSSSIKLHGNSRMISHILSKPKVISSTPYPSPKNFLLTKWEPRNICKQPLPFLLNLHLQLRKKESFFF